MRAGSRIGDHPNGRGVQPGLAGAEPHRVDVADHHRYADVAQFGMLEHGFRSDFRALVALANQTVTRSANAPGESTRPVTETPDSGPCIG